jgi:hypothetical protein
MISTEGVEPLHEVFVQVWSREKKRFGVFAATTEESAKLRPNSAG